MIESFVDLSYRGLPLGRRVKLARVRPGSAYLEMPAPMPVGTAIAITTDDGVAIDAKVIAIHEQVGGSERPPGMHVEPALATPAARTWWAARAAADTEMPEVTVVADAEADAPTTIEVPVAIDPPAPPVVEAVAAVETSAELSIPQPIADEHQKQTVVMAAVDPALMEQLVGGGDDGAGRTTMMDAVDLKALGLDPNARASQEIAVVEAPIDPDDGDDEPSAASSSGSIKRPATNPGSKSGSVTRRKRGAKKR